MGGVIRFKDCLIGANPTPKEVDLVICVHGTIKGSCSSALIQLRQPDFFCETKVSDGHFLAWLAKAGRYSISYRIFNNFCRHIADVEITGSCDLEVHYEAPKMTMRCHHLPAHFRSGGMVYLRSDFGFSGIGVESFEQFDLDFEQEPDLFLKAYNVIGLVVGQEERQFAFQVELGGVCELDFARGKSVPFQADLET